MPVNTDTVHTTASIMASRYCSVVLVIVVFSSWLWLWAWSLIVRSTRFMIALIVSNISSMSRIATDPSFPYRLYVLSHSPLSTSSTSRSSPQPWSWLESTLPKHLVLTSPASATNVCNCEAIPSISTAKSASSTMARCALQSPWLLELALL